MKRLWNVVSHWELWPFYVIYAPLGFVWLYYAFRARAFWFFSPVNPTLEFSGFEGESKKEMYHQLPEHLYPHTIFIEVSSGIAAVLEQVQQAGFTYPFIVKPQIGMQALMFRKIENEVQLRSYHALMFCDYLVQDLVELPMEFSVFHVRYPGQHQGKITGFLLKDYLSVTGNGSASLWQLIQQHPRASLRSVEMRYKHATHLHTIIPEGKKYYLSIAGNHNRGARFINLKNEIDERLTEVFDNISRQAGAFYFGRYDLKCTSVEDLKAGNHIAILEFNGVGAEPNHIYDCGMAYGAALKEIASHWDDMYRIARINNKKGIGYWNFLKGYRYLQKAKHFFSLLNAADLNCEL